MNEYGYFVSTALMDAVTDLARSIVNRKADVHRFEHQGFSYRLRFDMDKGAVFEVRTQKPRFYFQTLGLFTVAIRDKSISNLAFFMTKNCADALREINGTSSFSKSNVVTKRFQREYDAAFGAYSYTALECVEDVLTSKVSEKFFSANALPFCCVNQAENESVKVHVIDSDNRRHEVCEFQNVKGGLKLNILNFRRQTEFLMERSLIDLYKDDLRPDDKEKFTRLMQ